MYEATLREDAPYRRGGDGVIRVGATGGCSTWVAITHAYSGREK